MENLINFTKKTDITGRRVALVIPPSPFLLDERVFVSLGVLRVASSLESQGVHVGLLDLSGVANYLEAVKAFLEQNQIEWIGITSTLLQLPSAVKIANTIRQLMPNLRGAQGEEYNGQCSDKWTL